jgi:hypothetical protein
MSGSQGRGWFHAVRTTLTVGGAFNAPQPRSSRARVGSDPTIHQSQHSPRFDGISLPQWTISSSAASSEPNVAALLHRGLLFGFGCR